MKIKKKGEYGYIKSQRLVEIVKTLFMLGLSVGIYYLGIYSTGSNENLLTFVAVLGCLPMAKFAVNAVVFSKAKNCSLDLYNKLHEDNITPLFYDLYFTTAKVNYSISALDYKKKNLIMISEDPDIKVEECEDHIKTVLKNAGFDNITVKLFTDSGKFCDRLAELKKLPDEDKDITFLIDNILNVSI